MLNSTTDFFSEICSFLKGAGVEFDACSLVDTYPLIRCHGGICILPIPLHEGLNICPSLDGVRPIVIVEDQWRRNSDMLRLRLLAHLGRQRSVFARNCEIRRIDKPTAAVFLEKAHGWGDASCRFRYGMFTRRSTGSREEALPPGTLVAVATFSSARNWVKDGKRVKSCEWTRYASLPGVRVVGGMGRMLSHFIEDAAPDDVMSYSDLEWSDGAVYRRLGFVEEGCRAGVSFAVDLEKWTRTPIKQEFLKGEDCSLAGSGKCIYTNPGSIKFRLLVH